MNDQEKLKITDSLNGPSNLIFFDGTCGLCNRFVSFLLKRDPQKRFVFAPLEGQTAQSWKAKLPQNFFTRDSFVLIENYNHFNFRAAAMSEAAFRVFCLMGWPWRCLSFFSILPIRWTDRVYQAIAKRRGKFNKCEVDRGECEKGSFLP